MRPNGFSPAGTPSEAPPPPGSLFCSAQHSSDAPCTLGETLYHAISCLIATEVQTAIHRIQPLYYNIVRAFVLSEYWKKFKSDTKGSTLECRRLLKPHRTLEVTHASTTPAGAAAPNGSTTHEDESVGRRGGESLYRAADFREKCTI
jgi:hypothetical protein